MSSLNAVSSDVKKLLVDKINDLSSTEAVYGYRELNPDGWPCVWVTSANLQGTFATTAENRRIYGYNVTCMLTLGQDFIKDGSIQREEYAENTLATVADQIINYIDDVTFIADLNAIYSAGDTTVLFVEAADAEWGEVSMQDGIAKAIQITLMIQTDYNTRT